MPNSWPNCPHGKQYPGQRLLAHQKKCLPDPLPALRGGHLAWPEGVGLSLFHRIPSFRYRLGGSLLRRWLPA